MLTSQPLVSVVTPFYNTEDYLEECIKSVLRQSYRNFEYILVNNCSTDRSIEIADQYARGDSRIRIISNNAFLDKVKNYNHAVKQISAESKYCKIVQADDFIFEDCLKHMIELAELDSEVGIVSAYYFVGSKLGNIGLPYPETIFSGREICRLHLLKGQFYFGNYTAVMMRSQIVRERDPLYNEHTYHEDTEACYEILQKWKFGFVHQPLSYERTDNESLYKSTLPYNPDSIDYFITLNKYGPIYLEEWEYKKRLKDYKKVYFGFLGRSLIHNKDEGFWNYHKNGLRIIGHELNYIKVAAYALRNVLSSLIHLRSTIKKMIRKVSRNGSAL